VRDIRRTDCADEDLIDIWATMAAQSPEIADRTLDAIEQRWRQLARFPFSGRARDDVAPGMRCLIAGNYLTLYRIGETEIVILRGVHGRRKIDRETVKGSPPPV
jgi:toxin ParE1/3/4